MGNKVILVGGNHHNILGLVRSFGINGIRPYGVVIGKDAKNGFVRKSKYWAKTWAIESDEGLVDFLLEHFSEDKDRPVVICCSDTCAKIIDLEYDRLKKRFLLPSIAGEQGKIAELMDKQKQMQFAQQYGILMAKSCIVDLCHISLPEDIVYPCIVKPVVSAEGQKADIRKCDTKEQTLEYLHQLRTKGYHRFLVQEYIDYDYEVGFIGSCSKRPAYMINRKIRVWPQIGGSNSFVHRNDNQQIELYCKKILKILQEINFSGLFDVELLYRGGKLYLNEINWRNSGNSFFSLGSHVHYAVIWYYIVTGQKIPQGMRFVCDSEDFYAMDESCDLRQVLAKNISLKQWLEDRKKAKSFALWYGTDLKPTVAEYWRLALELVRRRGIH